MQRTDKNQVCYQSFSVKETTSYPTVLFADDLWLHGINKIYVTNKTTSFKAEKNKVQKYE